MAWVGQATQPDFVTFQLVRSDDTDGRIRLGNFYHAAYAIRKDPIVSLDNLAVFTIWRNARECKIVILRLCQKRLRMHQANLLGICASVVLSDFYGSISAAITRQERIPSADRIAATHFQCDLPETRVCYRTGSLYLRMGLTSRGFASFSDRVAVGLTQLGVILPCKDREDRISVRGNSL